ncbi:HCO3- transporter family protein [Aspergillus sclerotialis]|uniref:HCO3-transporter family protein n=1 Tax=Aspergillus sclerotialis TaxID=2070753 RepID=A0A3A2ZPM7_9EURO|nr:HCO3- transporter family protein [Aspergillus sclerotialis]
MAWSLIHAAWLHYILAIINAHDWTMRYVTTFATEIFSLLNSIIYFHKAIQELEIAHEQLSFAAFLYAVIGAVGTMLLAIFLSTAESWKPLFHRYIRLGLTEYAAAISIILFIGLPYIGELAHLDKMTLTVSNSFTPTSPDRERFFVEFWKLPVGWIFGAIIPGVIITMLFFFDHEVSSIICTIDRYGTRKPGGFAWDIVLLGTTTAICGILGIPPANGLLPQAPLHSESLMHSEQDQYTVTVDGEEKVQTREVRRVYEQRCPILYRTFYLLTPPSELPPLPQSLTRTRTDSQGNQTQKPSYIPIHIYTLLQIITTVAIFIITLTKAAPAFPVLIIALVPFRLLLMKRWFGREVLRFVDAWACREGTPEDDEDARPRLDQESPEDVEVERGRWRGEDGGYAPTFSADEDSAPRSMSNGVTGDDELCIGNEASAQEWLELDVRMRMDKELGRDIGQCH